MIECHVLICVIKAEVYELSDHLQKCPSTPHPQLFYLRGGGRIWIACPDIIYFITIYLCHEINCGLLCDILFYALKLLCHPFLLRGIKHWSCITSPPLSFSFLSVQVHVCFVAIIEGVYMQSCLETSLYIYFGKLVSGISG